MSDKGEYRFEDFISVVKRENNSRRRFLFLNKLQAKYIPSIPDKTIELFKTLGNRLAEKYKNEKVIVIGFAETATAIGAYVAESFGDRGFYIHTTRESLDDKRLIATFEEEHSHATSHYLYCKDIKLFRDCEVVILVDDELTTGKTMLNFINSLSRDGVVYDGVKFVSASLINCMSKENINKMNEKDIDIEYLLKEDRDWSSVQWTNEVAADTEMLNMKPLYEHIVIGGKVESREGNYINVYKEACIGLSKKIGNTYKIGNNEKEILVLGTEECMYPAIMFASYLSSMYVDKDIRVHATSRSPILPVQERKYPINNRTKLRSFYNDERNVFIYNLKRYDRVFIITDAPEASKKGLEDLMSALAQYENENIVFVEWVK